MLVFQAELYAILTSASLLCNSTNRSITICSDSQAALKSISAAKMTSHLVSETVMTLQQLSTHNCIQLPCVPGHNDIDGNKTKQSKQSEIRRIQRMNLQNKPHWWIMLDQNLLWDYL